MGPKRLKGKAGALRAERPHPRLFLSERGDLTGSGGGGDLKDVARQRQSGQAEYLDRRGWPGGLRGAPPVVNKGSHTAHNLTCDKRVANVERPVLHQHGCDRAASLVQLGFQHGSRRLSFWVGSQLAKVAYQKNHLQEQLDVLLLLG